MEQEVFYSGYCRMLDGSRTVAVVVCDGALVEADCCYGSCVHQPGCPVACKIREFLEEQAG